MPQEIPQAGEENCQPDIALHDLRNRQEAASQFSLAKGIIVGILGKIAGSYIVSEIRKPLKNALMTEVMHDKNVQSALSRATSQGETKAIIDQAMKTAAGSMKGLRGHVIRNPLLWAIIGGAGGGLGALGIEYAFHVKNKEENQKDLKDIKTVEDYFWRTKIENEQTSSKNLRV